MHRDGINISGLKANYVDNSLENLKFETARKKKVKAAIREILLSLLFAALTMLCTYQMLDSNSYKYQAELKNLFGAGDISTTFLDVFMFII